MAVSSQTVAATVRKWLGENLGGQRDIPDDRPLIQDGLLTSLQTIELVLFLEERFSVSIDEDEVDEENFKSIRTIADLVAAKTE